MAIYNACTTAMEFMEEQRRGGGRNAIALHRASPGPHWASGTLGPGCQFRRIFFGPHNFVRSLNLCDVADVTKGAACSSVATGRSGRAEEIGGLFLCDAA